MTHDRWNPGRYHRFREERSQPFRDLVGLVDPRGVERAVDLGCGTGELTAELHARVGARRTLGLDRSANMLDVATLSAGGGLAFVRGDLARPPFAGPFDLVFSNAALQWVDDHPRLFERLSALVAHGGQLAVQVPANHDHPSHVLAAELAREEPFRSALGDYVRRSPVLAPEAYERLLVELGFAELAVRLEVYTHVLKGPEEVVEWVHGTLLTDYSRRMERRLFVAFFVRYRERLLFLLGSERPHVYPFKRILMRGRRA